MITAEHVKPGACVIDVGTTKVGDKLRGDVDRESVEPVAGWLTPVPGGVGPMTVAMLMHNTVALCAARRGAGVPAPSR
jgi:5,10-methylene-tetrahydrofolate dehydrogenase/methenyl tetrahydrofolate cyclohydrolase